MDPSLKERFAQLGQTRGIDRVHCGSPAELVLRLPQSLFVNAPIVEDIAKLVSELTDAGVAAFVVQPVQMPDARELREHLRLTRDQFAVRYGFDIETTRNTWNVPMPYTGDLTSKSRSRSAATSDPW